MTAPDHNNVVVRLLGLVQAFVHGTETDLGASGPRLLFAVLATRAGTPVPLDELVAALWGEHPPKSAVGGIYTYVSSLRKALEPTRPCATKRQVLYSSRAGYSLLIPPDAVDLHRFEAAAERARGRWTAKDPAATLDHCDAALAEWGGPPLLGTGGPFADAERLRLELIKLDIQELRCAALLENGCPDAAVAELAVLVDCNPLRERLHELLMLALYRTGRQAEALQVYQRVRQHLVAELGIEPGPALRRAHERVLGHTDAPEAAGAPRHLERVVPAQLPHGVADFTGRQDELRRLERLCAGAADDNSGRSVVISAIDGAGGVGKTALAIHTAHRLAGSFPDGQLFLDLCGFDPRLPPVTPSEALAYLLRGLGIDAEPRSGDVAAQAALYRSLLAGRRVLVVLDNAVSAEQVRPLLPGSTGCLAIVTSRNRLAGLVARDGASRISLDVLRPDESVELLRRRLGADLVDRDVEQVRELAALCGHLPLALRIAAELIADSETYELADLVGQLHGQRDRLDALSTDGDDSAAVRAVFSWSYYTLKPQLAQAFRLLGLHPGLEIGVPDAAALLGCSPVEATKLCGGLVAWHLLEEVGRHRYRFHDLIRIYAAECAEREESESSMHTAVRRLLRWYLGSTAAAREVLAPGLGEIGPEPAKEWPPLAVETYDEAISWARKELSTLANALRLATDRGLDELAAQLASALGALFYCASRWTEWLTVIEIGQAAADRTGDELSRARLSNDRGVALHFLGRPDEAIACHQTAVELLTGLGDPDDQATTANLAVAYSMMGRHLDALPLLKKALRIASEQGNRFVEASVSDSLGAALSSIGRHEEAVECGRRSVELIRSTGAEHMLGHVLIQLGSSCLRADRTREAVEYFDDALDIWRRLGEPWGEVRCLQALARARQRTNDTEQARELLIEALAIMRDTGRLAVDERTSADIRDLLAELSPDGHTATGGRPGDVTR
jgi:DNA-binding SARP family transcriptional activator